MSTGTILPPAGAHLRLVASRRRCTACGGNHDAAVHTDILAVLRLARAALREGRHAKVAVFLGQAELLEQRRRLEAER